MPPQEIPQTYNVEGGLYLIATPIGAARDITLRSLDILKTADYLAAEDTRTLRHLMRIHGIALSKRPLISYHDHNEHQALPHLLRALKEGKSVLYASDAGTPLISDPGFGLVRAAISEGIKVTSAPGPSAALCALTLSGLPTNRFFFAGFPPSATTARSQFFKEISDVRATTIIYETPKRINRTLTELVQHFGNECHATLCRELTKKYEEIYRGTLTSITENIKDKTLKGELVLLLGNKPKPDVSAIMVKQLLQQSLQTMSIRDAATHVALTYSLVRRDVYQIALAIKES